MHRPSTRILMRVALTCSVRDAVNHESKRRNSRYTFAGTALAAFFVTATGTLAIFAQPTAAEPGEQPNIVLIMTDDQGYGDLGVTGNPVIETPHIDAMAGRSASLTTFYVSPVCAPTRACLMTGRYNYRTRVTDTFKGRAMMDPDEVTVAEVLGDAGYATGIFGKWHLGDCYPMRPNDQGFDQSLVHRGGGLAQPSEPIENGNRYTDAVLFRNGEQVNTKGYCTDVYFDAAFEFIDDSRAAKKPFFIYLPTNAPHGPFHDVPDELYRKYKSKDLKPVLLGRKGDADRVARIFAMIENVDQNVGRLFEKLDIAGLVDNTIVIFMVDNGPNSMRYVGNMRGMKSHVHDGGIRSPLFVHWPARLKAGTSSDRVAAHIDVMPTLLAAAGVSLPEGLKLDGRSLLPLLEGKDVAWKDRTLVIQSHRGDTPIRYQHFAARNQRWKLLRSTGFGHETPTANVPFELYDMAADPKEENNLYGQRPEIAAELKKAYDAWYDDVSRSRPGNFGPPRIVVGTDHETTTVLTWQDWRVIEPTGWGRQGQWLLHFAEPHTYDVKLRWPQEMSNAKAELKIGPLTQTIEIGKATRTATFEDVTVPAGDAELLVTITQGTKKLGPYHVVLIRN
jgi:arylsulfatase A-like enzyme